MATEDTKGQKDPQNTPAMATEWQRRNLERVLGEFRAFSQSLPTTRVLAARYADAYAAIVADLRNQGFDTTGLVIPAGAVAPRQLETNSITHDRAWTSPFIDRPVLLQKLAGAIAYVESILDGGRDKVPALPSGGYAINIDRSNVNLGTVHGDMRASIQFIEDRGQAELAKLLTDLIKLISVSKLSAPEKDDATQLADNLARELASRPPGGISAAVRPVASALGSILTRSAEFAQIWQAIEPFLTR